MAQHDMNLANASGATFRADANDALAALVSNSSGATAPETTFSYMWWADTTTGKLKQRNAANSAWIDVLDLATGAPLLQSLTEDTTPDTAADFVLAYDASATVAKKVKMSALSGSTGGGKAQDFRLTLTSGLPVTTANVTGATTIYACPYVGNQISLYTGSAWVTRSSAQFSLALGSSASGKPYDVFCHDNSGTPTLESTAWTDDATRATALTYQDGVLVKSGDATRRYLGTFYTTATGQTEDSTSKRYLWNYYHRKARQLSVVDATNSWSHIAATWRQANGSSANQVEILQGVAEDAVEAEVSATTQTGTGSTAAVAIGLDSTTPVAQVRAAAAVSGTIYVPVAAKYRGIPAAGRHVLQWLEYGNGTAVTFYGDAGATIMQSGITAQVMG